MELKYKNGGDVADSVGLLISILVRYPEVGTINYDPERRLLKFTFILRRTFNNDEWLSLQNRLQDCLETYNFLEGRKPSVIALRFETGENLSMVELERDVNTLTQDEISLITAVLRQEFPSDLLKEENESMIEEELMMQEEMIGHMLENIKGSSNEKKLIAFREEGRVLVFNK